MAKCLTSIKMSSPVDDTLEEISFIYIIIHASRVSPDGTNFQTLL